MTEAEVDEATEALLARNATIIHMLARALCVVFPVQQILETFHRMPSHTCNQLPILTPLGRPQRIGVKLRRSAPQARKCGLVRLREHLNSGVA